MVAEFSPVFSALGQSTRWRAFQLLVATGDDGLLQHEIAAALDVPKNLLSVHLKVLQKAGLVSAERKGREVTYRMRPELARSAAETMLAMLGKSSA